jgi:hypothetical protein
MFAMLSTCSSLSTGQGAFTITCVARSSKVGVYNPMKTLRNFMQVHIIKVTKEMF